MPNWQGDTPRWDVGGSRSPAWSGGKMPDWWQYYLQLMRGQFPTEETPMDWGWKKAYNRYGQDLRALSGLGNVNPPMGGMDYGGGGGSYGGGGGGISSWDKQRMGLQNELLRQQIAQFTKPQAPAWLPDMFSDVYGRVGTEQTRHRDWIKELMNLTRSTMAGTTADLARGLGSHLSRTNMPIPAGADVMARRYLSPMTQSMDAQLQYLEQLLKKPTSQLGTAAGLTSQLAPLFKHWWGQTGYPGLSNYLGGGR